MKLLNAIVLLACTIASVYASGGEADNEMTYYGCPSSCSGQENPSCDIDEDDLPSHFAALSTSLSHYHDYCGKYAVYMMADGSNVKKIARATVVDSCSSCAKYHLDLSEDAFSELREKKKGTGKIIWGIYSKSGEQLAGPFYNSVSSSAKKVGMSSEAFVSTFVANAKKLASSHDNSASFSSDLNEFITTTTTTVPATTTLSFATTQAINANKTEKPTPAPQDVNKAVDEKESKNEGSNVGTAVGLIALGGGCLGAAGAGLLFIKKNNPSTYDGIKQRFPEAFSHVKRGLTRKATSIKRRMTNAPKPTMDAANV